MAPQDKQQAPHAGGRRHRSWEIEHEDETRIKNEEEEHQDTGTAQPPADEDTVAITMTTTTTTMEHLDMYEPVERPSIYQRESFLVTFTKQEGPRSILLLIVCLAMGLGSTIGVVPAVMTDRYARLHHGYTDEADCASYDMATKPQACLDGSADAQNGSAFETLVSNVLTFVTSSLVGSISDEHGRRGVLIIGIFLSVLAPLCLVLTLWIPTMSPNWYYGARAITGLINWIAVALSSLSDVMPPEWRAASFGIFLAGLFLGFSMAPQLALVLTHFQLSVLAFGVVCIGFINTILFFPETLPPQAAAVASEIRREQVEGLSRSQTMWWNIRRPLWELSILNRSKLFRLLSLLAFFSGMVTSGDQTLLLYYLEERLAFNDRDVATMFLLLGVLGIFSQAVVLKPLIQWIGERYVVALCFLMSATDNFMYGIAKTKSIIFTAMAISAFTNMAFPTISAIKANNVEESEQGRIQGALYSVQALAAGTGPVAMRFVYHYTKDGAFLGPGSMFVFASFLLLIATGFAIALPKSANSRHEEERHDEDTSVGSSTPLLDTSRSNESRRSVSFCDQS